MYCKEPRGVWAEGDTLGGSEKDLLAFRVPQTFLPMNVYNDTHQSQIAYLLCPSLCSVSIICQVLCCILKMLVESKSKSICRIIWLGMIPVGKTRLPSGMSLCPVDTGFWCLITTLYWCPQPLCLCLFDHSLSSALCHCPQHATSSHFFLFLDSSYIKPSVVTPYHQSLYLVRLLSFNPSYPLMSC